MGLRSKSIPIVAVACVLIIFAVAGFVAIRVVGEHRRLTSNPLQLKREYDVQKSALIFLEDASSKSKTSTQSIETLKNIMLKLRDDWDDLIVDGDYPNMRDISKDVLANLYWSVSARVVELDCYNKYELMTLLDATKPADPSDTLWNGYKYALKQHGIDTIQR